MLGKMDREKAIALAQEKGLDLIEVNPTANPPVAKILDYGKYIYDQQKKEKKNRAGQRNQELKTVRIGFRTSPHDLETKAKRVDRFLKKGYRVCLEIFLRGREKAMRDLAKEKLENFLKMVEKDYKEIERIKKSPRGFRVTIAGE